jgi:hypothetical protein
MFPFALTNSIFFSEAALIYSSTKIFNQYEKPLKITILIFFHSIDDIIQLSKFKFLDTPLESEKLAILIVHKKIYRLQL